MTNTTDGAKVKDQIWAGEILESNQDKIDYQGRDMTVGFRKSQLTQGRNKSGDGSTKNRTKPTRGVASCLPGAGTKKALIKRMAEAKQQKVLKARIDALREERIQMRRRAWTDKQEKAERKKLNEAKSSKFVVINELSKTRKWKKQARKTLQKLPADIFYGIKANQPRKHAQSK